MRAFRPSIDSNATDTFKAQKGSKDTLLMSIKVWNEREEIVEYSHYICFLCTKSIIVASKNVGWTTDVTISSFIDVLTTFLDLERNTSLAVYGGPESSRIL